MRDPGYRDLTPRELKERLDLDGPPGERRAGQPVLLDVREPWEFALARIEGSRLVPMSEVMEIVGELDPRGQTVVICHHGVRSAAVAQFLARSGFEDVLNLQGGLDAYSLEADRSVPRY